MPEPSNDTNIIQTGEKPAAPKKKPRRGRIISGLLLFILGAAALIFFPYGKLSAAKPLSSAADLESEAGNKTMISLPVSELYYAGYDNIVNDSVNGRYFYSMDNGTCVFYLLTDLETFSSEDSASNQTITGYVVEDAQIIQPLTAGLAVNLDWSTESLGAITSSYLVIQSADHMMLYRALFGFSIGSCLLGFCLILLGARAGKRS